MTTKHDDDDDQARMVTKGLPVSSRTAPAGGGQPLADIDVLRGIYSLRLGPDCPAIHHWTVQRDVLTLWCPECGLRVAARGSVRLLRDDE